MTNVLKLFPIEVSREVSCEGAEYVSYRVSSLPSIQVCEASSSDYSSFAVSTKALIEASDTLTRSGILIYESIGVVR